MSVYSYPLSIQLYLLLPPNKSREGKILNPKHEILNNIKIQTVLSSPLMGEEKGEGVIPLTLTLSR
jgi:hypothetical protein